MNSKRLIGNRRAIVAGIAGNVMENACQWCAGRVRVIAAPDGLRQFVLTVEDDGPGLPPEKRSEVLRRGARLDERTPGSGLGLAIVDELARAYGGSISLGASPLGGVEAAIRLPVPHVVGAAPKGNGRAAAPEEPAVSRK